MEAIGFLTLFFLGGAVLIWVVYRAAKAEEARADGTQTHTPDRPVAAPPEEPPMRRVA
jgi:hypothetical protein